MSAPPSQRVSISPDALVNIVDREAVVLDLKSEQYFGFNETGARFWTALSEAGTVDGAWRTLRAEYDVDADALLKDLNEFVEKLVARGLIRFDGE
jgi:hypothetical protein